MSHTTPPLGESWGAGAQPAVRRYCLRARIQSVEDTIEIRSVGGDLGTHDEETDDTPCVTRRYRTLAVFDPRCLPPDYPDGYLPPFLHREEWEKLNPQGPSFDTLAAGDWLTIRYLYDASPGLEGHFPYRIEKITRPSADNVLVLTPR